MVGVLIEEGVLLESLPFRLVADVLKLAVWSLEKKRWFNSRQMAAG